MRGVHSYRQAGQPAGRLRFRILSALHGLLTPDEAVGPYDHSFSGMSARVIQREAKEKNIPSDVGRLLSRPFRLGLLLLADPYLRACDLTSGMTLGGPVIAFCSPAAGARLSEISRLRVVPLSNPDAQRFSCGMIALKGELGRRILSMLTDHPERIDDLLDPRAAVLDWLEADTAARQLALTAA
ncbi:MAG TPA: hypothetical protein VGY76_01450 [Solirubrobacteraceae bacterium]|nr:hypothetical protein [Solirubrobacteraceae bacterium]